MLIASPNRVARRRPFTFADTWPFSLNSSLNHTATTDSPSRRKSTGRPSTRYTSSTWFSRFSGTASLSADGVAGQSRITRHCRSRFLLLSHRYETWLHTGIVEWALAACCLAGAMAASPGAPTQLHLGDSSQGRPIHGYRLGSGPATGVVVGGIHGRPELNASELVWQLLQYFETDPASIPH